MSRRACHCTNIDPSKLPELDNSWYQGLQPQSQASIRVKIRVQSSTKAIAPGTPGLGLACQGEHNTALTSVFHMFLVWATDTGPQSQPQVKAVSGLWWNVSVSQHCLMSMSWPWEGLSGTSEEEAQNWIRPLWKYSNRNFFFSCSFRAQTCPVLGILSLSRTHRRFIYFEMFANLTGYSYCPEKHPVFF